MPYKYKPKKKYIPKYMRKKKQVNRSRYPAQKFRFSKGLSRSIVPFTRERETYFRLEDLTGTGTSPFGNFVHTTDGGVVGQIAIKLTDYPSSSDFTNLFRQYKLNYMKIILVPSATQTQTGNATGTGVYDYNKQVMVRTKLNRTGIAIGAGNTISEWSQVQAKKQWVLAREKATIITCRLSQLGVAQSGGLPVESATAQTEWTVMKPKYISTNNPQVTHFGLDIRFDSVDGTSLNQGLDSEGKQIRIFPDFRIISKVYFTCKGVA